MITLFSWAHNDEELTAELLALLKEQGMPTVGNIGKRTVILLWNNAYWALTDNGGELNIEMLNFSRTFRSIPYTSTEFTVNTTTMLYRIITAMIGLSIDYTLRIDGGMNIVT